MAKLSRDELIALFTYHAPRDQADVDDHEELRECMFATALFLNETLSDCEELKLAMTALREAMMWGNAGLALHRKPRDEQSSVVG